MENNFKCKNRFGRSNKKTWVLMVLCALFLPSTYGQVIINFTIPNPIEVKHADLYNILILNSDNVSRRVNIRCGLNFGTTSVFQSEVNDITLVSGTNQLSQMVFQETNVVYSNEERFSFFRNNQTLPAGNFKWCIQVIDPVTKEKIGSECFNITVEPLTPPLLVFPINQSVIPNSNPTFIWLGPGPQIKGDQFLYDIKVSEILGAQTPLDALTRNFGHIQVSNLTELQFPYPFNSPTLENGKKYAWQVIAHNSLGKTLKTDVWIFSVYQDTAKEEKVIFYEAALIPRTTLDGSFVNIAREIKLDLSSWNSSEMSYKVTDVGGKVVINNDQGLVQKESGQRFKLDFSTQNILVHKGTYTLEVIDAKGDKGFISFKYYKK